MSQTAQIRRAGAGLLAAFVLVAPVAAQNAGSGKINSSPTGPGGIIVWGDKIVAPDSNTPEVGWSEKEFQDYVTSKPNTLSSALGAAQTAKGKDLEPNAARRTGTTKGRDDSDWNDDVWSLNNEPYGPDIMISSFVDGAHGSERGREAAAGAALARLAQILNEMALDPAAVADTGFSANGFTSLRFESIYRDFQLGKYGVTWMSLDLYRPGPSSIMYSLDLYPPGPSSVGMSLDLYPPGPSSMGMSPDLFAVLCGR